MEKPTDAQIKAFWEWCGLVQVNSSASTEVSNSCEAMALDRPINGWYKPDYEKGTSKLISFRDAPIIDLNNLFKYAVPKLGSNDMALLAKWIRQVVEGKDPALALFWAILNKLREE